jgi:arginine/lysine/ornithine decarboxylase
MALFASTSPSYLILQSLDAANAYLSDDYPAHLSAFIRQVDLLKQQLLEKGFALAGQEPLKLTLTPKAYGYTGTALAALLEEQGLFCEFCDPDFLVLMLTPELTPAQLSRLEKVLIDIPRKTAISALPPMLPMPKQCCTARQALFSPSLSLPVSECLGKVLAQATVSCPPAIPPVVCGEILDETAIACLTYYGIDTCQVLA